MSVLFRLLTVFVLKNKRDQIYSFKFKLELLRKILVVHLLFLFCNREWANFF